MLTVTAENGELALLSTATAFIIEAVEERTVRPDVVHATKTHLVLIRKDAAKLPRTLAAMLRKPSRENV